MGPFVPQLASYRILAGVPKCGSMAAVCAAFLFNKAARITDGSSYDELIQASKLGRLKHDISELQVWTKARQYLAEACQWLSKPGAFDNPPVDDLPSFEDLQQQVKFLSHRGAAVIKLAMALQQQSQLLQESEDFDMDAMIGALDGLIEAFQVCQVDSDAHFILHGSSPDVELTCVCLSHLGLLYKHLGMMKQAERRYYDCISQALSMRAQDLDVSSVISGCPLKGELYQKQWFLDATKFMRDVQAKRQQEIEAKRLCRLALIEEEVKQLHANGSKLPALSQWLTKRYPRAEALEPLSDSPQKANFFRFQLAYSPDKQQGKTPPPSWTKSSESWNDFCTEVAKKLNYYYEVLFKGMN
ncbi:unnamed protein product [Effrenium voratum]|nr:unnamed protein product [Effrenium voratum]